MSDLTSAVKNVTGNAVSDMDIFNSVSRSMENPLKPYATGDSFVPYGQAFTQEPRKFFDYLDTLATKYGLVFIANAIAKNPLATFKRGQIPYGGKIESVVFDVISPKIYRPDLIENDESPFAQNFGRVIGDTYTDWFDIESSNTIVDTQDTMMFQNLEQFHNFVFGKISALINGAKLAEFYRTKEILSKSIADDKISVKPVANIKDFQKAILYYSRKFQYFSNKFNSAGIMQASRVDNIEVVVSLDKSIDLDVDFLANAFNAELFGNTKIHITEIDEFPDVWLYTKDHVVTDDDVQNGYVNPREHKVGSTIYKGAMALPNATDAEQVVNGKKVGAVILDRDALQLWDALPCTLSSLSNPKKRYTNIFLNQKTAMMFVQNLNSIAIVESDDYEE